MTRRRRIALALSAALLAGSIGFLRYSQVDLTLTDDDRAFATKILAEGHVSTEQPATFEAEIELIASVQRAVIGVSPESTPIPEGTTREPADLYRAHHGMCFDRSRTIEKILRILGFRTRHVSAYRSVGVPVAALAIFKTGIRSHAFSEVLTRRGWMVVDSNDPFLALDQAGQPADAHRMSRDATTQSIAWDPRFAPHFIESVYKFPFLVVYGFYSRHGRFYPPYNRVPDVNWGELTENL